MKRGMARGLLVVGVVASLIGAAQTGASADLGSGSGYGQHVRMCAQEMGLSGSHNPGMHQGYAGWHDHQADHCGH